MHKQGTRLFQKVLKKKGGASLGTRRRASPWYVVLEEADSKSLETPRRASLWYVVLEKGNSKSLETPLFSYAHLFAL